MESAITVKGQATIPKFVREHLGLKPGDRVKFFVHPDGSVVLLPKLPASAVRGMLKSQSQSRRARPVEAGGSLATSRTRSPLPFPRGAARAREKEHSGVS